MALHQPVLFVGDRPNVRQCLDPRVPFVGTRSYLVLLEWMARMRIDFRLCDMVNAYDSTGRVAAASPNEFVQLKIIALGKSAERLVRTWQAESIAPLSIFYLPHPSGLNRDLNDKKKLSSLLARCSAFIYKA